VTLPLALRATLAFLALPGIVAFAVPLLVLRPEPGARAFTPIGAVVLAVGIAVLASCVWEFYARGRGTLAPWDPPRALVRAGPYRYSRNPMYVGVLLILVGWATGFRSMPLGLYAAAIAVAFHLRIVMAEEPWLSRTFGEEWESYRHRVPRWVL
jgi:protein-S-isoprenylcysteine O-methyltransferase Ste14